MEYRFLALSNYTHKPFVSKWYEMGDGVEMNEKYWFLTNICYDIRIEIKEKKVC